MKTYTAAIYIRIATADQRALDVQGETLRRYAEANGYGNAEIYADNGYSGLNFDRPALTKLEADIRTGNIDVVIVRDIMRISRNIPDAQKWADRVKDCGVAVIETDRPCRENILENLHCFKGRCGKGGRRP